MQIKSEFYEYPTLGAEPRLSFGQPYESVSPATHSHPLSSSLPAVPPFQYGFTVPYPSLPGQPDHLDGPSSTMQSFVGKAPTLKKNRKLSMNDARPRPVQTGPRTMSFSMPSSGHAWDSMPPGVMPSFGATVEDAIFDSPTTPALEIDEQSKKQRRRECHNQVEKRRREHINLKIEELSRLLPAQYIIPSPDEEDEEVVMDSPKKKKRSGSTNKKDLMQCKGQVLSQSVQYIHDLRRLSEMQAHRIQQLESMMSGFQMPTQLWNPIEASRSSPEPELQTVWPVFEPSPFSSGSQSSPDQLVQRSRPLRKETEVDNQLGIELDMMLDQQKWA